MEDSSQMKTSPRIVWAVLALALVLCAFAGCSKAKQNGVTATAPSGGGIAAKLSGGADLKALAEKRKSLTSYVMSMEADGKQMTHTVKMANGQPVKMKMDMGGGSLMIIDMAAKTTYMYDAKTKTAMKMPQNDTSAQSGDSGMPKMPTAEEMQAKSENLRSETVDGVDCWVMGMPGPNGATAQTWIDKEWGLPRQEKVGDQLLKFKFTDINSVPDSAFELPAGAKIQDMGQMKGGKMPGMPGG
jgi:outer membrane lipoprotein-sorting protein